MHSQTKPVRALYRVPPELWAAIFNFLSLDELVRASGVCNAWRTWALDHPTFWRRIKLESTSPGHLHLTARRLTAGRARPVALDVNLQRCGRMDQPGLEEFVMRAVGTTVGRATRLALKLHDAHVQRLWSVLSRTPAPLLEYFELRTTDDGVGTYVPPMPCLPPTLFAQHAPRLARVDLVNVSLPAAPVHAFARATSVGYSARLDDPREDEDDDPTEVWHDFPTHLFTVFPALRNLWLSGGHFRYNANTVPDTLRARMAGLASLQLTPTHGWDTLLFLEHFDTKRIPSVALETADDPSIQTLLAQLPGGAPFALCLTPFARPHTSLNLSMKMNVLARGSAMQRTFIEPLRTRLLYTLAPLFAVARIPLSMWGRIPHHPSFPNVLTLTIVVDCLSPRDGVLPVWKLACPKLRLVVFEGMANAKGAYAAVDARWIDAVMRSVVHDQSVPFSLRRTRIVGPPKAVAALMQIAKPCALKNDSISAFA